MLKKSYSKYIIYIMMIITYLFLNAYITHLINFKMKRTFTITPIIIIYGEIKYILLGLILGLENMIQEKKKEGIWKINIKRLLIIGLPMLILSIFPFIYYGFGLTVIPYKFIMLIMQKDNITIRIMSGVILGYTIINSFIRQRIIKT